MSTKRKTYNAEFKAKLVLEVLKEFRNYAGQVITEKTNQVWSTDIRYIKLEKGFVYLAAIIDWHSKKIFFWKLSNSMDIFLVTSVLNERYLIQIKGVNTLQKLILIS